MTGKHKIYEVVLGVGEVLTIYRRGRLVKTLKATEKCKIAVYYETFYDD